MRLFNSIFNVLYFSILIIITVANVMCWDMVYRNPTMIMCMRSEHRVNFIYLSSIYLGTFGTITGST